MDRKEFEIIFKLNKKQPWLAEKYSELISLLFNDCKCENERKLLIELLDRFTYLCESDFNDALNKLSDYLVGESGLNAATTQIVSLTADSYSDSGQSILYALKGRLERRHWREHLAINRFGASYKEFNRTGKRHTNIVFVDEYIGSGKTVISRVDEINRIYKGNGINNITIKVMTVAASTVGLDKIKEKNIEVKCIYEIKKGITDFFIDINERIEKISTMNNLENLLLTNYNGKALPKLGYGEVESLYSRDYGNTPNNVFPIFWWPFYSDSSSRKTILTRAMGDA
ncbi:TPA: hypothetical protein SMP24_002588 [Proteus mirabilis]|uniref:phosphoribosyltransferase-like protein n=1 Tax=Proteus mirabilis TaxID=584 RepID=UPI0018C6B395|nr:hypothetical protein [Proteus mirabilis]EKX5075783.1 hypothetical protein [Proteus mirabilis]ELB2728187.1 hypothetical protein [Proteus mirabilis]ELN3979931.1 hypothetical protein [Proteus mirabilis]EMA4643039.1 hypothetical protein [Proteus mirabilis]EMD5790701.1 hypothetical protein [Proteus mirabilis]